MDGSVSERVAQQIAETRTSAVPPAALHAAKRVLLDATGVILGASGLSREADPFVALARESGIGRSVILGTGEKVSAPAAALANGAFAHALDFEDAFELSPGHPNASLVPTLLSLSQAESPVSGERFLTALVVGCELACRMSLALRQPMEANGWYPPPILAGFGAVAGAANLLGLDAPQVRAALSLMLCQNTMPGEIKYGADTQIRAVREAFPAQAAVTSVLLARAGVKGFEAPLDGRAGFYSLYANGFYDVSALTRKANGRFWIEQLTFKPWPSCRGTHAFIEMALALRENPAFEVERIVGISAGVDEVHRMLFEPDEVRRRPRSAIEAKFSIPFTLALALVRGQVALDDFDEGDLQDPTVLSIADMVRPAFDTDPPWSRGAGGALAVELSSGQVLRAQIAEGRGSPSYPLSDEALIEKFVLCAGKALHPLSSDAARDLAQRIMTLETCKDVGALF